MAKCTRKWAGDDDQKVGLEAASFEESVIAHWWIFLSITTVIDYGE
jgi:hypothetical protein